MKPPPILEKDPFLVPYSDHIVRRSRKLRKKEEELAGHGIKISDFARGHLYFGMHHEKGEWVFREWAPNAESVHLVGDFSSWSQKDEFALSRVHPDGHWEIRLPEETLGHKSLFRLRIRWAGGGGDRIPSYATRVVQDPKTLIFNAQVWEPAAEYRWRVPRFKRRDEPLLIYEAHVGIATEEERIGTYTEFTEKVIPRIAEAGYNTIQLMAIMEHPYYASFGYQVSSFFAPSSRFGTPDELKQLIDTAHENGLAVLMDLVHSHAVANETEGLSRFDGTRYQYFHEGPRGVHQAWGTLCFDYSKPEVLHFLLSNCRYWLDEFKVDGFRFDGVTSMIYLHHGLGEVFLSYDDYFNDSVDEDALVYLGLANRLIHQIRPDAVTIAEDVSGMPGLAAPIQEGGCGFDYRFAMGICDMWIRLAKNLPDEHWPMGHIWHELNNRRPEEWTISYAESHDQAIVGDQALLFRLIGPAIYDRMKICDSSMEVDRGIALVKMIRLITIATAGHGYLNFMGNEFGHPEWVDFPREGNNWSFKYARRQWRLVDDKSLKYHQIAAFDRDMILLAKRGLFDSSPCLLVENNDEKILVFVRSDLIFCFNFHPKRSYFDYRFFAPPGSYRLVLDTDSVNYGGHGRIEPGQVFFTLDHQGGLVLSVYLPARAAIVLKREKMIV